MMTIGKFVTDSGATIFRIRGKLISSSMDKLKAGLETALEGDDSKIIINFRNVSIVDSAAAGLLISRARSVKKKSGYFCFCELQPAIYRLFSLMNPDNRLDIFITENEAIASIQEGINSKSEE